MQQAKLKADDGVSGDSFGWSVAAYGDTVIVGARLSGVVGSTYIFVRENSSWVQQAKLSADDGFNGTEFGYSVAIFQDTAIVGAFGHDLLSGAAYVFERASNGTWAQQMKLSAEDEGVAYLGHSVGIYEDTVIIGAPWDDNNRGSAYVFARENNQTWVQEAKLIAEDGVAGDQFGWSAGIHEGAAIIGAHRYPNRTGCAYIFAKESNNTWVQEAKLSDNDSSLGRSVAIYNDTAVIGAIDESFRFFTHIFVRDNSTWVEKAEPMDDAGEAVYFLGSSVAIFEDTVIVGAINDNQGNGSAYVFLRP